MQKVFLIVHNVRSAHNVDSILRTADGFGINEVYLTGYTPYPVIPDDSRLPHVVARTEKRIAKTALGAQKSLNWHYQADIYKLLNQLRQKGLQIIALEQTP